ncbi:hypothetical protein JR316_0013340 [Psilocybe cubensis]|uniref:Uncharacterized protein n=1 Tax=Psilocybe cubensis TaxID=181762 RepID=A0ACB8GHI9_PSICU|nr:hypothetical protein JR316_0013340 [Psilocybe cubensis]KAH9474872.1 hypothetical protein JR316_0013340 [Psilocybe cubensis]
MLSDLNPESGPLAGRCKSSASTRNIGNSRINYELPGTVVSLRDGWQWTCQSGAVVSGLLAAVAGQFLGLVRSVAADNASFETQSFLLTMCYAAILFNISATIGSFIIMDNLGEMGFRASCKATELDEVSDMGLGTFMTSQDGLLIKFGASPEWKWMLYHWEYNVGTRFYI